MLSESDVRGLRYAHSAFNRRGIDTSRADVRMMHGVIHVRGTLAKAPGSSYPDLRAEVDHTIKLIKSKPEVRDVVLDVVYASN